MFGPKQLCGKIRFSCLIIARVSSQAWFKLYIKRVFLAKFPGANEKIEFGLVAYYIYLNFSCFQVSIFWQYFSDIIIKRKCLAKHLSSQIKLLLQMEELMQIIAGTTKKSQHIGLCI